MSVIYDEVYISTMREMNICKKAIKRLRQAIENMERKYNLNTAEFIEGFKNGGMRDKEDYLLWHTSYEELKNWEERLKGFSEILQIK